MGQRNRLVYRHVLHPVRPNCDDHLRGDEMVQLWPAYRQGWKYGRSRGVI